MSAVLATHPRLPAVQGGRLVRGIETDSEGNVTALVSQDAATGSEERHECDAVVFAISIAGEAAGWPLALRLGYGSVATSSDPPVWHACRHAAAGAGQPCARRAARVQRHYEPQVQ